VTGGEFHACEENAKDDVVNSSLIQGKGDFLVISLMGSDTTEVMLLPLLKRQVSASSSNFKASYHSFFDNTSVTLFPYPDPENGIILDGRRRFSYTLCVQRESFSA
jgi:hypothetical protein